MKHDRKESTLLIKNKGILSLSGEALKELLQAVLDKGVPFRFRAKGFSMSPFIKNGDLITVSPFKKKSIKRGLVVAFIHPETGYLVVHRVINRRKNDCVVKGDNRFETDGYVPLKNIIGYVSSVEREGRQISLGLGPERGIISFFFSKRITYFFITLIKKFLNHIRKKRVGHG